MIDFLFWVLVIPISILVISLYFIACQFVVNKLEAGLKSVMQILVKIKRYWRYGTT